MNSQLKQGMKIESEHKGTYNYIKNYYKKHNKFPAFTNVTKKIAGDHIKEKKNYYDLIKKYKL